MILIKATTLDKDIFNVKVDNSNYYIIKELLSKERTKIINKLKTYKSAGLIGSINYPRNKTIQKELDELVYKKRIIKDSISKITSIFYH